MERIESSLQKNRHEPISNFSGKKKNKNNSTGQEGIDCHIQNVER